MPQSGDTVTPCQPFPHSWQTTVVQGEMFVVWANLKRHKYLRKWLLQRETHRNCPGLAPWLSAKLTNISPCTTVSRLRLKMRSTLLRTLNYFKGLETGCGLIWVWTGGVPFWMLSCFTFVMLLWTLNLINYCRNIHYERRRWIGRGQKGGRKGM